VPSLWPCPWRWQHDMFAWQSQMMHHHTIAKSGYNSFTDTETNITRNVDPLLWPWTQQCHIFTGQSTTKLSSVAKESLVQKIQQKWSYFGYTSPHLKFEDSNSVCLHASVAFDDAPPYHVCLQEAEQFRIHLFTHTHLFQCTELRSVFINLKSGSL